jgi:acetyl esterase/lipase
MPSSETPTPAIEIIESMVYADVNNQKTRLDIYAPMEEGPLPIAVIVHGLAQSRQRFHPLAQSVSRQGFVVYNINAVHDTPWSNSIHRIACAVRYARGTADDYNGDPNRIVLVGHSAGAATGVVAALSGDDFGENCQMPDESALVSAFVGYEGPYNFSTFEYKIHLKSLAFLDHTHLKETDPDLWHSLNPYNHIGRYPEITIRLIHGSYEGEDVPLEVSADLYQALLDANHDVELAVVENATHSDIVDPTSDAFTVVLEQVVDVVRD